MRLRYLILSLALLACACLRAAADAPTVAPKREFPQLVWHVDESVPKALRAFTSSADPQVVFVSSSDGLWRSHDGGARWEAIAGTAPAQVGTISCLVVCPARPEFVVFGSTDKGVSVSCDDGSTWRTGGSVAEGLSSRNVHQIEFSHEDRGWNTILACHGADGRGLSKSVDGGRTWRVVCPTRHVRTFLDMGQVLVGVSASAAQPDEWQAARSINYAEEWQAVPTGHDVLPSAGTESLLNPSCILWGTQGGGLLFSKDDGKTYEASSSVPDGSWTSVFVTPGADPHEQWFWAYEPFRNGLFVGRDLQERWTSRNDGLYVSRMTKQGANVAANANGTRFYACVNGSLYVGDHVLRADRPTIRQAWADPSVRLIRPWTKLADLRRDILQACETVNKGASVDEGVESLSRLFEASRGPESQRRFVLRVRVEHPRGAGAVKSVTVTPDLLGVGTVTLSDDGRHDDGKAGDGLWGGEFTLDEDPMWDQRPLPNDNRSPFPGIRCVPVSAVDDSGKLSSWTLPIGVFFEPEPCVWFEGGKPDAKAPWGRAFTEGGVSAQVKEKTGKDGGWAFEVIGKKGAWDASWATLGGWGGQKFGRTNITGFEYVTIRFRGSQGAGDVGLFLVDELTSPGGEVIEARSVGNVVALLQNKYLAAMDGEWHEVKVPVLDLVRNVRLMRNHVVGFGLHASDDSQGGTYLIDEVRFGND